MQQKTARSVAVFWLKNLVVVAVYNGICVRPVRKVFSQNVVAIQHQKICGRRTPFVARLFVTSRPQQNCRRDRFDAH